MGRRRKGDRVLGPYHDPRRAGSAWEWSYEIRYRDGTRERCPTRAGAKEEEARAFVEGERAVFEAAHPGVHTVSGAMDAYEEDLRRQGHKNPAYPRHALAGLLATAGETPLASLSVGHLLDWLAVTGEPVETKSGAVRFLSMATRRSYWKAARRWSRWLVERGHLRADLVERTEAVLRRKGEALPWRTIGGSRELRRGKDQLTGTQWEAYVKAALLLSDRRERVAAVLPAQTGATSGEVRHLRACDVDLVEGCIWLRPDAGGLKPTEDRARTLPIPETIREDVELLVQGLGLEARLFPREDEDAPGEPHGVHWLLGIVRRVCKQAKVPRVTVHGLRGTFSTMLHERKRRDLADVGLVLGHADGGETARRHYVRGRGQGPVLEVLSGGAVSSSKRPATKKAPE